MRLPYKVVSFRVQYRPIVGFITWEYLRECGNVVVMTKPEAVEVMDEMHEKFVDHDYRVVECVKTYRVVARGGE